MKNNDENLEYLLRQFVDQPDAQRMAEDIRYADRLFEQHPAPSASPETLSAIRQKVHAQLEHRRRIHRAARWCSAAAAVAIALLGVFILHGDDGGQTTPPVRVAVNSIFSDTSIAEIEREITRLSEAINAVNSGISGGPSQSTESENNSIAHSAEFWKG